MGSNILKYIEIEVENREITQFSLGIFFIRLFVALKENKPQMNADKRRCV